MTRVEGIEGKAKRETPLRFKYLRWWWRRTQCFFRGHGDTVVAWSTEPDPDNPSRTLSRRDRLCRRCFTAVDDSVDESAKFPRPR